MTCSSHEFVIINHHGKPFCRMLPDERLDNRHGLPAARSSDYPRAPKTVAYRNPTLTKLTLVIVPHGDIHAVLVLYFLLALFKTFILEVEPVSHQSLLDELRDIIQGDMHQYHTHDGSYHIENDIQRQRVESCLHRTVEQPHGKHEQ